MQDAHYEARKHVRAAIATLNLGSRALKAQTRRKHDSTTPAAQSNLRLTQRRLTILHAMLAYARGRAHAVNLATRVAIDRGVDRAEVLSQVRHHVERHGDSLLGAAWKTIAPGVPALSVLWIALVSIPDPEARASAVHLGGLLAAYR